MASTWGNAWGAAWGDSWGVIAPPPVPGGGFIYRDQKLAKIIEARCEHRGINTFLAQGQIVLTLRFAELGSSQHKADGTRIHAMQARQSGDHACRSYPAAMVSARSVDPREEAEVAQLLLAYFGESDE